MNSTAARLLLQALVRRQNPSALCNCRSFSISITSFGSHPALGTMDSIDPCSMISPWRRMLSSASAPSPAPETETKEGDRKSVAVSDARHREMKQRQAETGSVPSYWGVRPAKVMREDGSAWPWNCFMVGPTPPCPDSLSNCSLCFNQIVVLT